MPPPSPSLGGASCLLTPVRPGKLERKLPPEATLHPAAQGRNRGYWLYLLPGLILLLVIVIVPLAVEHRTSRSRSGGASVTPEFIGLENWQKLLTDEDFWTSFANSIWMVIAMVVVPTTSGSIVAALLVRCHRPQVRRQGRQLPARDLLPAADSPGRRRGHRDRLDRAPRQGRERSTRSSWTFGIPPYDWLGQMPSALIVLMVVLVWVQIGYPVVIFMAALQRVDPELYEAAELDGANWFQRFSAITVSIIRPEIFVVTLTSTIAALKVFGPVYVITRRRSRRRDPRSRVLRLHRVLHQAEHRLRRNHRNGPEHRRRDRVDRLHPSAELDRAERKGGAVMAAGVVLATPLPRATRRTARTTCTRRHDQEARCRLAAPGARDRRRDRRDRTVLSGLVNSFKSPVDYANGGPLALPQALDFTGIVNFWNRVNFPEKVWNSIFISGDRRRARRAHLDAERVRHRHRAESGAVRGSCCCS